MKFEENCPRGFRGEVGQKFGRTDDGRTDDGRQVMTIAHPENGVESYHTYTHAHSHAGTHAYMHARA